MVESTKKVTRLTRRESQQRTRSELLESAKVVISREGYEGASVDTITEEAGYSKGAFYSNFNSKDDLVLELLETHSMDDVKEIGELLEGVTSTSEMINIVSDWADRRSTESTWGVLALELLKKARRESIFGDRHARLFLAQWKGIGELILPLLQPKKEKQMDPELLGAIVAELAYSSVPSYIDGPDIGVMVRSVLTAFAK